MPDQSQIARLGVGVAICLGLAPGLAAADLTDFTSWTLVEDPPNAFFSATIDSASTVTLTASDATGSPGGIVPAGVDIGYQSVDAGTVAASVSGFAFAPGESFALAVDYDASFAGATDGLSFGFGIGEDNDGMNSAGVVFVTQGGLPATIPFAGPAGGAARVNDSTIPAVISPAVGTSAAELRGSLHVAYDATSGDITVGVGPTGANAPTNTAVFPGADVSGQWAGVDLLVSLFIRSDTVTVPFFGIQSTPWAGGEGEVVFGELRVVSGAPFDVGAACVCDRDANGVVSDGDFFDFVNDFSAGDADLDGNGITSDGDFFLFVNCFGDPASFGC